MKLKLKIYGMDCVSCSGQVSSILRKIKGVDGVKINFSSSLAEIESVDFPDLQLIEKRLGRCGYSLPKEKININTNIEEFEKAKEEVHKKLPALSSYEIKDNILTLFLYPIECRGNEVISAFKECNLPIEIEKWESGNEDELAKDQVKLLSKLILCVFLTLPLLWNPSPYLQFALATLILLIPANTFVLGAIRSFHGGLNMDVLILTSTCLVYSYSTYLAFTSKDDIKLYFLCEGVLVSLVLFGRYLEILARGETERSLRGFVNLLPRKARYVCEGEEIYRDIDEINVGDVIKVLSGERIPNDGILIKGDGLVDESLLTGESVPVKKVAGEKVTGGTLLRSGEIFLSVDKIGRETSLEQMIELVSKAQISSSPIRKLADRIVAIFIPSVILIGVIAFCIWYFVASPGNLDRAILSLAGILVVSCPCALGLAIPTSIMVGNGRCSQLGILFKNATAIEKIGKVKIIAFDKTGTLTYGGEDSARNLLRNNIPQTINKLSKKYKIVMISGDKKEIAENVAREAGIDIVFSEIQAKDKAKIIEKLKKEGQVMMVGDGVNDAPAMAQADLSVSIQNGTDLARDTAEIIILGDDISKLPLVFELASKIMRNIHENLLWATLYNAICIPLAAMGYINPSLASAAMSFSSIAVLMNALRLNKMKGSKNERNGL